MSRGLLDPASTYLLDAVSSAPSADNAQPWCFEARAHTLSGFARARGGFPVDYHATELALGAAAENLAWALRAIDADPAAWRIAPPDPGGCFFTGPAPAEDTALPPRERQPWLKRHTHRVPYHKEALAAPDVQRLIQAGDEQVDVVALQGDAISDAAQWVRDASEVRFQTREVNEWFAKSLRYGPSPEGMNEGLHVDTLALPPGGVGLLRLISDWKRLRRLNALGAYKLFARIEAANFQRAPLVLAIVGAPHAFDAGRCLQRVWLEATGLGLSAQPYYVVSDLVQRLRLGRVPEACEAQAGRVTRALGKRFGPTAVLHCLLRVGKPVSPTIVSGRLPLERLMCNAPTNAGV